MINSDKGRIVQLIAPAAVRNNSAYTTNVIDTLGAGRVTILINLGVTDAALTTLKLQESDSRTNATTLTNGVDVPGAIFGTSTNDAGMVVQLPTAADGGKNYAFTVILRGGRKRYLQLQATVGNGATGAFLTAAAILGDNQSTPSNPTARGYAGQLSV